MSSGIARCGDKTAGHDSCAPVPWESNLASNVFINSKAAVIIGSIASSHGCITHSPHNPNLVQGSSTVFMCGKGVARVNDACDCGDKVSEVSSNVFSS